MHGLRPIAKERGQVMHVPCIARLGDESYAHALACLHEALMHRADREEHRNRCPRTVGIPVADYQDRRPATHRGHGVAAQPIERARQTIRTGHGFPDGAHRRELRAGGAPHCRHLFGQQDRMLDAEQTPPPGTLREQRTPASQIHHEGHHALLAQRIDRGVRHLGEALPHIGVQALRGAGQRRNRRIVAHAPDGVLAGGRHRRHDVAQILEAVAERVLARGQLVGRQCRTEGPPSALRRQLAHDATGPAAVRRAQCDFGLCIGAVEHGLSGRVDHEQLAGSQSAGLDDMSGIEVDDANLRTGDHHAVASHFIAAGSQPVAVERRARDDAVCECDGGRTVPRFHQSGVVLIEAAQRRVQVGDALPRFRNQHHQTMHGIPA